MPLIKPLLELQILTALKKQSLSHKDISVSQQELAADLATAIDSYIRSALITVPPGQLVVGVSASAAGPGVVTASTTSPITATII